MRRLFVTLAVAGCFLLAALIGFRQGRRLVLESEPLRVGTWRPLTALPFPRVEPAAIALGSDVYFFGGFFNHDLQATPRVDVYNVDSGEWRRLADMPVLVTHLYAVAVDDGAEVWFAGGFDGHHPGTVTNRMLIYHPAEDRWSEGPPLPEARAAGGLARLGNRLHYAGGLKDRLTAAGDHWALDLDGDRTWRPRASLPAGRSQMPMLALNGELFVVGGQFGHDQIQRDDRNEVHAYDPRTDAWRVCAPLPRRVSHMEYSSIAADGKIIVFGGRSLFRRKWNQRPTVHSDTAVQTVQTYDPSSDRWSTSGALPLGMLGGVAVEVGGRVLVGGGSSYLTGSPQLTIYEGDAIQ